MQMLLSPLDHPGHDPIVRDWPAVPRAGDWIEVDIGEEEPLSGSVRVVMWGDGEGDRPLIEVRFR